jgi:phage-related protein
MFIIKNHNFISLILMCIFLAIFRSNASLLGKIKNTVSNAASSVNNAASSASSSVNNAASSASSSVNNVASSAASSVNNAASDAANTVSNVAETVIDAVGGRWECVNGNKILDNQYVKKVCFYLL